MYTGFLVRNAPRAISAISWAWCIFIRLCVSSVPRLFYWPIRPYFARGVRTFNFAVLFFWCNHRIKFGERSSAKMCTHKKQRKKFTVYRHSVNIDRSHSSIPSVRRSVRDSKHDVAIAPLELRRSDRYSCCFFSVPLLLIYFLKVKPNVCVMNVKISVLSSIWKPKIDYS